jgi:phosphate transport system protein
LRECIAAIRISGDIERIGDLAKNIAKRTLKIVSESPVARASVGLRSMHEIAATQLKDALDAYALHDVERARMVWENDVDLDALEDSVFRDLLTFMMEDPRNITFCTHHTTNIADTIVYLVTGETMQGERPKKRSSDFGAGFDEAAQ